MVGKGKSSLTISEILDSVTEFSILSHYINITKVPCVICSPLRKDRHPSFGLYSPDGSRIRYIDYTTNERGGTFDLLMSMWGCTLEEALVRLEKDLKYLGKASNVSKSRCVSSVKEHYSSSTKLDVRIRRWMEWDIEYWKGYGISIEQLDSADVYPIDTVIFTKNSKTYNFPADKYAYVYVERKEGNVTLKVYQPFSKTKKWLNKHDKSVVSLWSLMPDRGSAIVICSSVKDALCLTNNTGLPAIAVQGEGYSLSDTAISELKRRFARVYICFDNDEVGLKDGLRLSEHTGFINVVLPQFEGGKDISDFYKSLPLDKKYVFRETLLPLFT